MIGLLATVAAPALAMGDRHRVTGQDVYLRTYPQSWFLGTLYQGAAFDVQGYQSGYAWGYAYGNFNGCAWVSTGSLDDVNETANAPDCGSARRLPLPDSAHSPSYGYDVDGDGDYADDGEQEDPDRLTAEYEISCDSASLFGNYRDGHHTDRITTLGRGAPVGWRWTTSDGRSAAIRSSAADTWAFVLRDCIQPRG